MTTLISIAMASHNGAKYLQEQLDSFLYQTRQPDELVVSDDCSSDATLEILEDFRQKAPFDVRIYRNKVNLGYIDNFEKVLSLCKGDIIFLSDQDDVWFCEKVKTMAAMMTKHPEIFVLQADMVLADEDMNPSSYSQLGNILALGQSQNSFVTGCGTVLRKEWLDIALPINSDLVAHDSWLHRLAIPLGVRALHVEKLQYYRRHGDNASNWLASRPARMTELDALLSHGFGDASKGWSNELERVKATLIRIKERTDNLDAMGLGDSKAKAISVLTHHLNSLNDRIQVVTLSRLKRFPRVLEMWMRGSYGHFAGWKSAVKDILRP